MPNINFRRAIHFAEEVSSTQDAARDHAARDGVRAAGHVHAAAHQTAGRGRHGKTWYAPPGANLCMTLIGGPAGLAELWQVAFVAALAAADTVTSVALGVPVHLRFPNDVMMRGKKVGGVLIETATGPDVPTGTLLPLVGVGINVRGRTDALPPQVAVRATTVEAESGGGITVEHVGGLLADAFAVRWQEWDGGQGFAATLAAWHEYHDPDERRTFVIDGAPALCRVVAVSTGGETTLELPDRTRRTVPVVHVLFGG